MTNAKREKLMNKMAFAAFLLGVFTLSPMARAEDLPPAAADVDLPAAARDGLKWSEVKSIAGNFSIKIEGDSLVFGGSIPRKCAAGRVMTEVESSAGVPNGRHALKIDMPACRGGALTAAEQRDLVQVRAAFPPKSFDAAVDGKFCLKNSATGDGEAACDDIVVNGRALEHTSQATKDRRLAEEAAAKLKVEQDAQARRNTEARTAEERRLVEKIGLLCRNGDFQGLGLEIEAARAFLGDISKILEQVAKVKQKKLEEALKKAKNPEELKEAYEAYLAEATTNGWDTDEALKVYTDRRLELVKEMVANKDLSASAIHSAIRELMSDLREAGSYNKEAKKAVTWLYSELGTRLSNDGEYTEAETYYTKALETADDEGKVKIEQAMAKMFLAAAEACLEKNKASPAKCDALAAKARKHMDGAIAAQGRRRGDDNLEELNAMKIEKIQAFGMEGINVKVQGYGSFNPYGGAYDQRKRQMYQTGVQELYMQRQMQQSMGGMTNGTTGGSSFFR